MFYTSYAPGTVYDKTKQYNLNCTYMQIQKLCILLQSVSAQLCAYVKVWKEIHQNAQWLTLWDYLSFKLVVPF